MRVGVYARVSTRKDQDKQDPENQLTQLREYATSQPGWRITNEYVDFETGSKADREQFQLMLQDASEHRFDILLFWSLDRLTREGAYKTLVYLNQLSGWGVRFRSLKESYLDSCGVFGEAVVAILGCIAKQERLRFIERTKAGIERRRAKGLPVGRQRRVFDRYKLTALRDQGMSMRAIARELGISPGLVHKTLAEMASISVGISGQNNAPEMRSTEVPNGQ
jgi:DNA invertase Pin-like site-specific DNA recombinase